MTHEIETAAAGSLGGFFRFRRHKEHALPLGTPCANCATPLQGPWCHNCGQVGEDFHRSIWRLMGEVVEGLLHFDGRVWRTLPDLFLHPGRLTRAYLDGHRAPQIPPLRLFLVVLLVVFFAGSLGARGVVINTTTTDDHGKVLSEATRTLDALSPEDKAKVKKAIVNAKVEINNKPNEAAGAWLKSRVVKALDDPERFKLVLEQWSERFAFLTLPLSAAILSLLFVFQRRFYIFDHTIFSLHSLSAMGLLLAVATGLSRLTGGWSGLVLIAAPFHLFVHMRGVYETSVFGTLLRMTLLFIASATGVGLIFVGLLWVGLNGMGA
jgi:hypothetical protein